MSRVAVTIDGRAVCVAQGFTLLQAADAAAVYVPRLCAHPSVPTRGHCGLCAVEVEGLGIVRACETPATAGARVDTGSARVRGARTAALKALLAVHPHACLACDLREGCGRSQCSYGTPVEERCCEKFGRCEFQRVADFVGIGPDAPTYVPQGLPEASEGLYTRNVNLCIGCLRCEAACRDVAGAGAVGARAHGRRVLAWPAKGDTMKAAGCVFCGACVQVCPTGALLVARDETARRWYEERLGALGLESVPEPPKATLPLDPATVSSVPETEGVYHLYAAGSVRKIKGVLNLKRALSEELGDGKADSFTYEEAPLYTSRETQLMQRYLARHGHLPGGDELDDLF